MRPHIDGFGMFLGIGNPSALSVVVGLVVVSCLVLLAWGRTRNLKKKVRQTEPAKVGVVEPVEADAARASASEKTATAKARKREQEKDVGIEVVDEPGSGRANGWPVTTATSGIAATVSPEGTDQNVFAVESSTEVAPDPMVPAIGNELVEPVECENEQDPTPTNQSKFTSFHDSNGQITAGIASVIPANDAKKLREAAGVTQLQVPRDPGDQTQAAIPAEEPDESVAIEAAGELAGAPASLDEPDGEQFVGEPDEVDLETGAPTEADGIPPRYRAPRLVAGKPRTRKPASSPATDREQVLDVRIRCISDRHGFCRFQLLAQRPPGAPAGVEARNGRCAIWLSEAGDDWYEVSELSDLSMVMERGTTFSVAPRDGAGQSWELRGRDIYVLAGLHGVLGFVSTTRLCIGRQQIVLYRESQAGEVGVILAEAGCAGLHAQGAEKGSPAGWVFFRPVTPSRSVPQVPGDNILNLIRPVPDIEVLLEGGLWLQDSAWMVGYPPSIHITGEVPAGTRVTIDGEVAEKANGSVYRTRDSGRPGTHVVWCAGKSASYSICEPDESWEQWEEHRFPRGSVCGAVATRATNAPETLTSVPTTNPVLIGANPGELFRCDVRPGKQWTGFVPFPVCWALPADPLHCDRSLRRVLLITPVPPVHSVASGSTKERVARSVLQWCYAIRDCQRKRLGLSPGDAASEQLWRKYTTEAKAAWRAMR